MQFCCMDGNKICKMPTRGMLLKNKTMVIPIEPTFKELPPDSIVSQFVLRIIIEGEGLDPEPVGTAVLLTDKLAITAKHTFHYVVRKYRLENKIEKNISIEDISIRLYQILPGPQYVVWEVRAYWDSPESDLALLAISVAKHSNEMPPRWGSSLKMLGLIPPIGSKVVGVGYHSSTAKIMHNEDGSYHLDINDTLQVTTGVVREIYPDGRDRGNLPFPCYQVNARFNAGMSGGAVLSEDGILIGIICSSFGEEEGEESISYVSFVALSENSY